jgi:hypothetical protein
VERGARPAVLAVACLGSLVLAAAGFGLVQQGPKLTGAGETGYGTLGGGFGDSVAISADGSTAIVGGRRDGGLRGAAWIFTRTPTGWAQQGPKLTGAGEVGLGQFGISVAISATGNTVLVGGRADNNYKGAAWVFHRSGSTWTQQGRKLTGSGEIGAGELGWSVALSADGSTALVGGEIDNSRRGAAWLFHRSQGIWTQQGPKLTGPGEKGEGFFGYSVALSAKASTGLIGGPFDGDGRGAAWVLTRSAAGVSFQAKLTGLGQFGASVALSADGATALIAENSAGSQGVWPYRRVPTTGWIRIAPKLAGAATNRAVGSVALAGDGATALVGTPGDANGIGTAWAFRRAGTTWAQQGGVLKGAGEVGAGGFGSSATLSGDGTIGIVGGPGDNTGVGAAWVVVDPPVVTDLTPPTGPILGGTSVTIFGSRFTGVTSVRFGSVAAPSFTVVSGGQITVIAPQHAAGTVPVTVVTTHGTSAVGATFTYQKPAAVG